MPSAPQIRKQILNALDDHIIPALTRQEVLQVLAEPPFHFRGAEHWAVRQKPLADKEHDSLQVKRSWPKEKLVSLQTPTFGFVYEGMSYEKLGVTARVAKKLRQDGRAVPPGISVLRLPAPGIVCYSGHTPHGDGSPRTEGWPETGRVLAFHIMGDDVLPFICEHGPISFGSHTLEVNDPPLVQMAYLYIDELRQRDDGLAAQGLLLAFMYRLRRNILKFRPTVSNSSWASDDNSFHKPLATPPEANRELYLDTVAHIQIHLHRPLTLPLLAAHAGVSTVHLNRIFRQNGAPSVMRLVTEQRINAAKEILCDNPERVSDIAKLVGFSRTSSFCAVFQKHTGMSPSQFRRLEQAKQNVSNKK